MIIKIPESKLCLELAGQNSADQFLGRSFSVTSRQSDDWNFELISM